MNAYSDPGVAAAVPFTAPVRSRQDENLARFLPSLADFAFLLPAALAFVSGSGLSTLLNDGDTGWHIRTGEWILAHGSVPHQDLFSFTMPNQPWFAWEWLWDILFAKLHASFGLTGVALASLLLLCLTSLLVFRLALRRSGNPLAAATITFFGCNGSTLHWHARPHLITLLFVALTCTLFQAARRRVFLLWLMPLLMLLWTNLHGGFIAGLTLIIAETAGSLIDWARASNNNQHGTAALRRLRRWAAVLMASVAVTFANPYGYHLHEHLGRYLGSSKMLDSIAEFQSISFHPPVTRYIEIALFLAGIAAYQAFRDGRFAEVLMLLAWAHMALVAGRNVPIFLIVAASPSAAVLCQLFAPLRALPLAQGLRRTCAEFNGIDQLPRLHLPMFAGVAIIALLSVIPNPPADFQAHFNGQNFPITAVERLPELASRAGLLTTDQWADYVIYQHPAAKVFFDGRSDFYGADFSLAYMDLIAAKPGWAQTLAQHRIRAILLPPTAALTAALKESISWKVDYDDGKSVLFHPRVELP